MASSKIIVTNVGRLEEKYGEDGFKAIDSALDDLIAADASRDIKTEVVGLDDTAWGSAAVKDPANAAQNKAAVDAVFEKYNPDYLMILGSLDVVPYQDLANPAGGDVDGDGQDDGDEDALAPGDLPYACAAPYSRNVRDFLSPTRVVGRLPDLGGESDPDYLVKLLQRATRYVARDASDYAHYLGASAQVWTKSTQLSLTSVFGSSQGLHLCPPSGPSWGSLLAAKSHFVNCHGSPADPQFYGQKGSEYPVAFRSDNLQGVTDGTVAAFECCYGSELYDPSSAGGEASVAQAYLRQGAYAVWASSTIAYGPADSNEWADNMCQYFMSGLLKAASSGRAALEARQTFIGHKATLDPYDLKTLAQYNLLGDPSIHPIRATGEHGIVKVMMGSKLLTGATASGANRIHRRQQLQRLGLALGSIVQYADVRKAFSATKAVRDAIQAEVAKERLTNVRLWTQAAAGAASAVAAMAKMAKGKVAPAAEKGPTFHVAIGRRPSQLAVPQYVIIVASEDENQVVIRKGFSR